MTVRLTASSKAVASLGFVLALGLPAAATADRLPSGLDFSIHIFTEEAVEGLIGDSAGNLYTTGRQTANTADRDCPVYRANLGSPTPEIVGFVRARAGGCSPSGLTFNAAGALFIADGDKIHTLMPGPSKPFATIFAEGVPGANGVTFDRDGNLWVSDGTQNQGRVWRISPDGDVELVFRVQPMRNDFDVGRETRTLPGNPQNLVANGLIFNSRGDLLVADTARGAIWRVRFDRHGNLLSRVGCDTTFTDDNTLCLDNVFVAHPYLEGADGIDLDRAGNIWVSVNERNAIVVVTRTGDAIEAFRNDPDPDTQLRNEGPLEFPTSPFVLERHVCTANSDGGRRDNAPNSAGDISPNGPNSGKISCASLRH